MSFKSICIVGVDGTGKSSTINCLAEKLSQDDSCIQYMGARLWETKLFKKYNEKLPTKNPFIVLIHTLAYIREMYHRYYKHKKDKNVVIFDRYAYEHALLREATDSGIKGKVLAFVYRMAFVWLYPKPGITVYLICPVETSLSRKSDISTKEQVDAFKNGKEILDDYYLNQKKVLVIDTSINQQGQVVDLILQDVRSKWSID